MQKDLLFGTVKAVLNGGEVAFVENVQRLDGQPIELPHGRDVKIHINYQHDTLLDGGVVLADSKVRGALPGIGGHVCFYMGHSVKGPFATRWGLDPRSGQGESA